MNNNNNPLISVRILTYNSAKYVLETLESVKAQTYPTIELIVSDDCSSDYTVELCENWIKNNQKRFIRCVLLTSPVNTGVAPNSKRSLDAVQGEWIKGLAADDCLEERAIETFVNFVMKNECDICVSGMIRINENGQEIKTIKGSVYDSYITELKKTYEKQLSSIYNKLFIPGPATFYSTRMLKNIGGYSDAYPFADEWPFFFKVLNCGYRIFPLEDKLIRYRVCASISHKNGSIGLVNERVINSSCLFFKNEVKKVMIQKKMYFSLWHSMIYFFCKKVQIGNSKFLLMLSVLLFLTSPKFYINGIGNIYNYLIYLKLLLAGKSK